jgi:hypothetical protein
MPLSSGSSWLRVTPFELLDPEDEGIRILGKFDHHPPIYTV